MPRTDAVESTLTVATTSTGVAQTYFTGSLCAETANAVRMIARFLVMAGIANERAIVQVQHGVDNVFFTDLGTPLTLGDLNERTSLVYGLAGDWVRLKITYSADTASARLAAVALEMTPIPIAVRRPPLHGAIRVPSLMQAEFIRRGFRVGSSPDTTTE